jgi:hypothetical protein
MRRLGYTRFVAQGGDWGAQIHRGDGAGSPAGTARNPLQHARNRAVRRLQRTRHRHPRPRRSVRRRTPRLRATALPLQQGRRYATQMALRPQTLYGLADSPIALAAWMLDHDARSYEDIAAAAFEGRPVGNLTRDEILDNITLTWVMNTGISSGRLYWEKTLGFFVSRAQPSRPPSASSRASSTRRRGAGPSGPIPTSSTSTTSTRATTSPPGRSRNSSPPSSGPPSNRCVRTGVSS